MRLTGTEPDEIGVERACKVYRTERVPGGVAHDPYLHPTLTNRQEQARADLRVVRLPVETGNPVPLRLGNVRDEWPAGVDESEVAHRNRLAKM